MTDDEQKKLNAMLSDAAVKGNAAEVEVLLAKGADVNSVNDQRRTPLIRAAWKGSIETVEILLAAGADPTLRDEEGHTAEDDARAQGNRALAIFLQEYVPGGNPDEIIFQRQISNRTLEEIFNFVSLERISLVRKGKHGPVEAITYTSFENVNDQSQLRQAFEEHVRRGGKTDEALVFPNRLPKKQLKREG